MNFYLILCVAFLSCFGSCSLFASGSVQGGLVIGDEYDEGEYQAWIGPGWYYGVWFVDEAVYDDWLLNHFYDVRWGGPNWYYGVWFGNEVDFVYYRNHHRYHHKGHYRGHSSHHRGEHRGEWGGRRHAGGGGVRQGGAGIHHGGGARHGGGHGGGHHK